MDIHHPYAQFSGSGYGVGSCVRDIVEFQVEEDIEAALLQVSHNLRAKQRKHFFADFKATVAGIDTVDKGQRGITVVVIQGNYNRRISNYAGSRGTNRRHDQPFSSMGAQRRGTDKRRAFYLPAAKNDRSDFYPARTQTALLPVWV
ncbi:hypothetical protein ENTCAN_06324 [Enterobacter cancerogenus ATCC 35316]|nr:hypothetical protein ENTCAN_06324 [Enterobacter cancerogenus ATCC 35316]